MPIFYKPAAFLVPVATIVITAEMLAFCGVHLASRERSSGPMIYWLIVAAVCAFIAYGRFVLKTPEHLIGHLGKQTAIRSGNPPRVRG